MFGRSELCRALLFLLHIMVYHCSRLTSLHDAIAPLLQFLFHLLMLKNFKNQILLKTHGACVFHDQFRAWAKKHRRSLLVAAGVAGAGVGTYYFVSSMKARAKAREERDERQSAILRKEAEDRAEAQYAHVSNPSGALSDFHRCMLLP